MKRISQQIDYFDDEKCRWIVHKDVSVVEAEDIPGRGWRESHDYLLGNGHDVSLVGRLERDAGGDMRPVRAVYLSQLGLEVLTQFRPIL